MTARPVVHAWSSRQAARAAAELELKSIGGWEALNSHLDGLFSVAMDEIAMASAVTAQGMAKRVGKIIAGVGSLNLDFMGLKFRDIGETECADLVTIRNALKVANDAFRDAGPAAKRVAKWARKGEQDRLAKQARALRANRTRAMKRLALHPGDHDAPAQLAKRIIDAGLAVQPAGAAYYSISVCLEMPCETEDEFADRKRQWRRWLNAPRRKGRATRRNNR